MLTRRDRMLTGGSTLGRTVRPTVKRSQTVRRSISSLFLNLIGGPIGRLTSAIVTCVLVLNPTARAAESQILMQAKLAPPDPNRVTVGSSPAKHYIGLLKNNGKSPVVVQIMHIPGRGDGNGRFRSCYLERWDVTSRQWINAPQAVIEAGLPLTISTFKVKPGDSIVVCDTFFAKETGLSLIHI